MRYVISRDVIQVESLLFHVSEDSKLSTSRAHNKGYGLT